jgi:hypothetical protein
LIAKVAQLNVVKKCCNFVKNLLRLIGKKLRLELFVVMSMTENECNCSACYIDKYFKFSIHPIFFVMPNLEFITLYQKCATEINILFLRMV